MTVWKSRGTSALDAAAGARSDRRRRAIVILGGAVLFGLAICAAVTMIRPARPGARGLLMVAGPNGAMLTCAFPTGWTRVPNERPAVPDNPLKNARSTASPDSGGALGAFLPLRSGADPDSRIEVIFYRASPGHTARMRNIFDHNIEAGRAAGLPARRMAEGRSPIGSTLELDATDVRAPNSRNVTIMALPSQYAENDRGFEVMILADSPDREDETIVQAARFVAAHLTFVPAESRN